MTHLKIELNNTPEIVSAAIIHKLYNSALSVPEPQEGEEDNAYLSGNLLTLKCNKNERDYLINRFLNLIITATDGYYVLFEDSVVLNKLLANNYGDGIGITDLELANISIGNIFYNDKNITKFNEFLYFTKTKNMASTFYGCSNLTSIIIPDTVTNIDSSVFQNCTSLTSITIPNSVTSIGNSAFSSCSGLTSVTIPDSVTDIGRYAFSSCSGLTSVTIPDSVTDIGGSAFEGCYELTSVTIPNSVTILKRGTFYGCSSLTTVTIPNSVTNIEDGFSGGFTYGVFQKCTNLTSVTIGNGVTSIGGYAFYNCNNLISITIETTTPPALGTNVFGSTNNCLIYVPASVVSDYQTASGWSTYASRIRAIPN